MGLAGVGAGKGDKSRVQNVKAYRANYADINWHRDTLVGCCERCAVPVTLTSVHCHRPAYDLLCPACYTSITI